ncbi:MAG: SUF system NifU family Fe-S cluster assembly protein [Candidatus Hydrogenedens sp.]|jgi:nitrogen fixation NifU-like protein|nr:SUF system NifU family Fe-S cluster assembly protein [Candidatus Hydrogenedens sp.]
MSATRSLYEQVILDHNRNPRNYGEPAESQLQVEGVNPLCGDAFILFANLDGDTLSDIRFSGHGCAISKASASLMTTLVKGQSKEEALRLFHLFHDMLQSDIQIPLDEEALGKLMVFAGVREYPMRIKCAMLPWHALHELLYKDTTIQA